MSPLRSVLRGSTIALLFLGCSIFEGSNCAYVFSLRSYVPESRNSVQSVPDMEKAMKEAIIKVVETVLSKMMDQLVTLPLSPECDVAVFKFARGALEMHDWAVRMIDASGKPSAGILEGTAAVLGDYDECLDVESPTTSTHSEPLYVIRGQYCMVKIDIPDVLRQAAMDYQAGNRSGSYLAKTRTFLRNLVKIAPRADIADLRVAICIPSACSVKDLESVISAIAGGQNRLISVLRCETNGDNQLQVEQIAIMAVLGVIALLMVAGTLIDTILRIMASGPVDDVFFRKQNTYIQFLVSFSLGNNFRKLARLEVEDGQLSCVRGIKFLSVCLVIVVSTYAMPIDLHFLKYRSAFNIYKFMNQWWFSAVANSSAVIDTLFFLAGLQITYRIWKKAEKNPGNKVSINIVKFLIVWYSRLTASQLLVIALFLLFPLIGSGPLWKDVVIPEVEHCRSTWWMNVLSINNFWPGNETCLYHTWFVTSLMQMLIITPFILWILNRWNIFGILLIFTLILGSCIAVAMVTLVNELPPAPAFYFISFLNMRWIWDKMFIQAYDHMAPFFVGILMGYILGRSPKIELRKITAVIGWCIVIICNLSILFGLYCYHDGEAMESTLSSFYASAHRFAWAVGIAWIVFACAYGYGGAVGDFLSWKAFIPFERLSSLIYLLHPLVIFLHTGQVRERMYMAHLDQAIYASAYIFLTCILAALCYVVFVVPYRFLESRTWRSRGVGEGGHRHHNVSKVIAIKERVTNDFTITMRDTPVPRIIDTNIGGIDNSAFDT